MAVINRIADYFDDMKSWRQHLHQHPELDFDCVQTAAFVTQKLTEFGVDEIHQGIAQTGVVALIKGKASGGVIGLRADMDALPIQEVRDHAYKSQTSGKMHACGHDGHTTILLGAARYLAETRNFAGTVALIFQPGEEGAGGGRVMCEEGIMDRFNIDAVYGLHNWPNMPVGSMGMRAGAIMAAADRFTVTVTGKGGHAAMPHLCTDPILAASAIVQGLNTIVSRNVDPMDQAVISVTQIHGGDAFNVIPEQVDITGTLRTFKSEVQSDCITRMEQVCAHIGQAYGCTATFDFFAGYPATVNDAQSADFAADVAQSLFGAGAVDRNTSPSLGGEDFSYMLQHRPGAYVFLGQGPSAGLHHPEYDFNDEASPFGASYFARLIEMALPVGG